MNAGAEASAIPAASGPPAAAPTPRPGRPDDGARPGRPISVEHVSKCFFHKMSPVQALRDVSLDIAPGAFVSLIGPSGCGKSTLLRIIGGLEQPDSGTVRIGDLSPDEARAAKCFGLAPQSPSLLPWRTVIENVSLLREIGTSRRARRGAGGGAGAPAADTDPRGLIQRVGLTPFVHSLPKELSGGMQQRVSLVRAFTLGAPILLMDEPFAALDEITRDQMRYQLLDIWSATDKTVVFVTHSIPEAVILSDFVVTMAARPGRVIAVERIDLPRPRSEDMEFTPEFSAHAQRLRDSLRLGWAS